MSIATLWDAGNPQAPTGFSDWGETLSDTIDSLTDDPQWRQTHDVTLSSADDFPTIALDANYQSAYIEFNGSREESGTAPVFLVGQNGLGAGEWRNFVVSEHATDGKTTNTFDNQHRLLRTARLGISGSIRIVGKRRVLSMATAHDSSELNLEMASSVGSHQSGNITAFTIRMDAGTFSAGGTLKVWQFF